MKSLIPATTSTTSSRSSYQYPGAMYHLCYHFHAAGDVDSEKTPGQNCHNWYWTLDCDYHCGTR
eukprot:3143306-Rhodomonas_salina.1